MSDEGMMLGDLLKELANLIIKYKFNRADRELLMDRLLMFGEAVSMIEELLLSGELEERHKKACEEAMEVMENYVGQ